MKLVPALLVAMSMPCAPDDQPKGDEPVDDTDPAVDTDPVRDTDMDDDTDPGDDTDASSLGSLGLSGPDVGPSGAGLESTFAPDTVAVAPLGDELLVSWEGPSVTGMIVTAVGGDVVDLTYNQEFPNALDSYFYRLDCDTGDCSGIVLDEDARTLQLDGVALGISDGAPNNNGATGAITASGTLRY